MKLFGCLAGALVCAVLFLGGGCAHEVVIPEVLQLPQGGKVYTRHSLWFEDADKISCLNIQRGRILPLGTEVTPVYADESELKFTDASGNHFRILFDPSLRMMSMREFILQTFTLVPPGEILKGIPENTRRMIQEGTVAPGMTRAQVLLAYGPPPAIRTPLQTCATWIYWLAPNASIRVNFSGDTVRDILNPNQP